MDEELARNVEKLEFWDFCSNEGTGLPRKTYWGKVLKPHTILSFSKQMSGTILKVPHELIDMAEKNFKSKLFLFLFYIKILIFLF